MELKRCREEGFIEDAMRNSIIKSAGRIRRQSCEGGAKKEVLWEERDIPAELQSPESKRGTVLPSFPFFFFSSDIIILVHPTIKSHLIPF
ncbi:hypothetical protein VNO78_07430 [Psophocarpus tetragonolobus]|uniref:Uncharacterized protein n=1 Tax=Psophocarpus tetragonolobus TaxID=3891 RepID=A0AAN9XRX1_PSOTE